MKFLVIAPRFHTNLYYRVLALQNAGHQVKIVVLYKGESEYYKEIDIEFINLSFFSQLMLRLGKSFRKSKLKSGFELRFQSPNKRLRQVFSDFQPDFVLLKAFQNLLAVKTLFISLFFKSEIFIFLQTNKVDIFHSKLLFRFNLFVFKILGVRAYITPVKQAADLFKDENLKNCFYVPFVYPAKAEVDFTLPRNGIIKLISVGKFVPRKGQLFLLQAIDLLKDKFNIVLTLIGEKADAIYFNKVLATVSELGLQKQVTILLNVNYNDIETFYLDASVFVLPSYAEPAAYSPVEALACGLPIVLSSDCGTNCYVKSGENGYIFKTKNCIELANCIEEIIKNSKNLLTFKKNALLSAKQNHNLSNFCKDIEKIIAKRTIYGKTHKKKF